MGGDGSDLNGASREGNGATSVAAAKTDEAGLEFLPVFESPPPPPQRRKIRRPAKKPGRSGRGGALETGGQGRPALAPPRATAAAALCVCGAASATDLPILEAGADPLGVAQFPDDA